ncbi:hypothetical protein Pse7367_1694 [Thalassoporum mexicanum PCC 7367]|uniref:hypothetical protein n=1 Tax=Thalassoporum mexicanum TaxID=3457544 RepID=UPI00029F8AFF|nr:hypothetical protein [Pseudanabaena sp. PCC 7367]AFY69980.1 hypothetical protein Pse7367_1694 [Pseudanabaena sp. PCC 7367]
MVNTESQANNPTKETTAKKSDSALILTIEGEEFTLEELKNISTEKIDALKKTINQISKIINKEDSLVGSMTRAELKELIAQTVREVVQQENSSNSYWAKIEQIKSQEYVPSAKPISQIAAELFAKVPEEEWAEVPEDASRVDEYLYGHSAD